MKLLHTSDWHLGRSLYSKKRYQEFQSFLDWMVVIVQQQSAEILIIAGDIFDTTTPSNSAQEMYYQFLCQVAINTQCQHIVIIGGNHDSPTLLNAPKEILKLLKIHVLGSASDDLQDELLELKDQSGEVMALICAVPYLRDRDIRTVGSNETASDKDLKLMSGIKEHYQVICDLAIRRRKELAIDVPIIALGHLFVAGGQTEADDGVRELYVGGQARFGSNDFPAAIDYLALGHLHIPQKVAGRDNYRYSGSPLAMGFGEAYQQKIILEVTFNKNTVKVNEIAIPKFQRLERISGNLSEIIECFNALKVVNESVWVEVNYTGTEIITNLQQQLEDEVSNSSVELIKVYNRQLINQVLSSDLYPNPDIELSDLTPLQVFEKCLALNQVPEQQQAGLVKCYLQILDELPNEDIQAQ